MSDVGGHDPAQGLARDLSHHMARALDEGNPSRPLAGAREAARHASLPGLDRLLGALGPYATGPWPVPLRPVVDRLRGAAEECGRSEQLDVFRRLDDELGLMARAIERVALGRPSGQAPARPSAPPSESAAVSLADVLEGIPGQRAGGVAAQRIRLRSPVAGALRAALDWLVGGNQARTRMWLTADGSALDVVCEGIAYTGIQPAGEVLSSVGAHLGPTGERPGAWTVRVPIRVERETFLMLEQDELQLAVPWPAVVRVRLIPSETIDVMLRRQTLPVLPPLAASTRRMAEQPVTVVALGLKRACLVADRLVWRMPASPAEPPGPVPAPGLRRAVRSDDGEVYWVLEPEWLLRGIPVPAIGQPGPRPGGPPPAPSGPPASERSPAARPPLPFTQPAGHERGAGTGALPTLDAEHVEPLEAPGADGNTATGGPESETKETPSNAEGASAATPPPPAAPGPGGAARTALTEPDRVADPVTWT